MKAYYRSLLATVAMAALVAAVGCSKSAAPAAGKRGDDTTAAAGTATEGTPTLALLKEPMDVAPFTVTDLDGKTVSIADLKGKVVLVNFWATWCPPCRAEIPDLVKLQEKYRDKLVILGISEDEDASPQEVKAFGAEQKMNYPIVMKTPELSKVFKGVSALPTTFVIDPEGKIRQRH